MARKSRKNVGLIGLGIIGSRVAASLRASGFHVFVWNRTPKPAPNFVGSPAEVAEICDVIQLFVADANATRDVIEAFGEQLGPRHVVIGCGTIGPEATVEIAEAVQSRGAAYLDCPFTGSKGAAEKGQLVYYVGGDEDDFLRVKPVLEASSRSILRCGRVGDASTLKIATNLITAVTTQTLAEALALVKSAGIPGEALAAALEHNACKSGVVDLKLPKMLAGDYEPHFSVKHMFKDVQLGIHIANRQQLEVPLTTVVGGVLYGALSNGWGDLDFASLYRVYSDAPPKTDAFTLPSQPVEEPKAETAEEPAPVSSEAKLEVVEETKTEAEAAKGEAEAPKPDEPVVVEATFVETVVEPPPAASTASVETAIPVEEQTVRGTSPEPMPAAEAAQIEAAAPAPIITEATVVSSDVPATAETPPPPAPAAEAPKDAEKTAAAGNGIGDEPAKDKEAEEDNGLAGFFSRVFRRKGTPAGK